MTPPSGERSSKYRVIAPIGRGGMGSVHLAVTQGSTGFTKLVVIKQARPDLAREPEVLAMFLDEARLAARLNHPNVVQTYEAGEASGTFYIAMEYLDGQSLARIRSHVEPEHFPLSMQIRILTEALAGLHYAHELTDFDGTPLRMVHRDANPQNIFVTYDGQIKVVDFGIAKATVSRTQTATGMLKGKVTYMAPEQARQQPLDRRADIFAVGVMLWEAMTGTRMWKGLDEVEILMRLFEGKIPRPPADSPELARICARALAPAPADRYPTAAELQGELERWLALHGDEVPARAVGRFVAMHFDEERTSMKALIERKLGDSARSRPADPEVAVTEESVDARVLLPEEPRPAPDPAPAVDARGVRPGKPGPAPANRARRAAETSSTLRSGREPSPAGEEHDTLRRSSVSFDTVEPRRAPPRSRRSIALSAAAMIIGGAAAAALSLKVPGAPWITHRSTTEARVSSAALGAALPASTAPEPSGQPATGDPASPPPRPTAIAAAQATPVGQINLTVSIRPATARITLDQTAVGAAFYKGKLPKDSQPHRIHAEAPGFVPVDQVLAASSDITLLLELDRKPPPAP